MGAAVSTSYTEVVNEAYARSVNKVVVESTAGSDQTQIIYVGDVVGDVDISGNTMYQNATVNMTALQSSMADSTVTQQIVTDVLQQVKAEISGINFFNFAVTNSTIKSVCTATVEVVNTVTNSCQSYSNQTQAIVVQTVHGNVSISDNNMEQFAAVFADCTQEAVSKNAILQDIQQDIATSNETTTEGVSPLALIILLSLIFFGPYFFNAAAFLKMIFPIFIVFGILRIINYFGSGKPIFLTTYFSQTIRKMCPDAQLLSVAQAGSREEAERIAANQEACVAYDLNETSMEMTLFSYVNKTCQQVVKENVDQQPMVQPGLMIKGGASPTVGSKGNGFLNTQNADYWLFNYTTASWAKQGSFVSTPLDGRKIDWGFIKPSNASNDAPGTIYVWYEEVNPDTFTVYTKESSGVWSEAKSPMRGPGLVPYDSYTYYLSAFVEYKKQTSLLITGIAMIAFGIIGFKIADKKSSKGKSSSKSSSKNHHDNDRHDNDRHDNDRRDDDDDRRDDDRRDDDDDRRDDDDDRRDDDDKKNKHDDDKNGRDDDDKHDNDKNKKKKKKKKH